MLDPRDKLDILALFAEYNRCIDAGDARAWARTFVEDGVFHHPARAYNGRAELEGFVKQRAMKNATHPVDKQRHWNDAIRLEGTADRATSACDLLVAGFDRNTGKPSAIAVGDYTDELVKVGSEWRFLQRTLRVS